MTGGVDSNASNIAEGEGDKTMAGSSFRVGENETADTGNFTCIEADENSAGKEIFECNYCNEKFDSVAKTRKHINAKHRYLKHKTTVSSVVKRKTPDQEAEEKESSKKKKVEEEVSTELDVFSDTMLKEWQTDPLATSTQFEKEDDDDDMEETMDETIMKGDEGRDELVQKLEAVQVRAAKMETKLVEKEEKELEDAAIIKSLEAVKETLEQKVKEKEKKEMEFQTAFMNLKKKISILEKENGEGDGSKDKAKMKKLAAEIKAKQKANDDLQEQLNQMTLKAGEETNRRVCMEVELTRSNQTVDRLLKIQEKDKNSSNGSNNKEKEKEKETICRDWLKPTGCRYGSGCRWLHRSHDKPPCYDDPFKLTPVVALLGRLIS